MERHKFKAHHKAWGAAHTGPGVRFICTSDAVDDADHKGFWTTLALWCTVLEYLGCRGGAGMSRTFTYLTLGI